MVSLTGLLEQSPLLFWTIVLVACQMHDSYSNLYEQIYTIHHEYLSHIVHSAVKSVEVIHALLLLCLWPVPNTRHLDDPAWSYIGIAINAAMQLQCHKPWQHDSTISHWRTMLTGSVRDSSIPTLSMTWLSCFDISTRFVQTFVREVVMLICMQAEHISRFPASILDATAF